MRGIEKSFLKEERVMLNKKLVLGSLAGATLLVGAAVMMPTAAEASVVSGTCVNCHTMHNSDEGNTQAFNPAPQNQLLKYNGCVGCHATADNNDPTLGKATTGAGAPQVNDSATPLGGGYFDANSLKSHNVIDTLTGVTFTGAPLTQSPGGSFAQATFDCTDCHGAAAGAHHSSATPTSVRTGTSAAGDSYRFLSQGGVYVAGNGLGNYEVLSSGMAAYDATSMNAFCATCHDLFHGTGNTGNGPFVRHPTNVSTNTYGAISFAGDAVVPVGDSGNTNQVMCISCHRAHGSDQRDLLRFNYNLNQAGDTTVAEGCEDCHGAK